MSDYINKRLGNKTGNIGFGNLTSLKELKPTTTTTSAIDPDDDVDDDSTTNNTTYCTKIMRITSETFERLRNFSHKHPQPISYDEIFQELLDFYNNEHDTRKF